MNTDNNKFKITALVGIAIVITLLVVLIMQNINNNQFATGKKAAILPGEEQPIPDPEQEPFVCRLDHGFCLWYSLDWDTVDADGNLIPISFEVVAGDYRKIVSKANPDRVEKLLPVECPEEYQPVDPNFTCYQIYYDGNNSCNVNVQWRVNNENMVCASQSNTCPTPPPTTTIIETIPPFEPTETPTLTPTETPTQTPTMTPTPTECPPSSSISCYPEDAENPAWRCRWVTELNVCGVITHTIGGWCCDEITGTPTPTVTLTPTPTLPVPVCPVFDVQTICI